MADPAVLQQALTTLSGEIIPTEEDLSEASAAYKKSLSLSLFYKVTHRQFNFQTLHIKKFANFFVIQTNLE